MIDIHHSHTVVPFAISLHTGRLGNVFKFQIAFIQVQFIGNFIACEVNIGQTIIVDIADANPTPIVYVRKNVKKISDIFIDDIFEGDSTVRRVHTFKYWFSRGVLSTCCATSFFS